MVGENLHQPSGGIEAIVKAIPALFEENVPAHLSPKLSAGFLHTRLDHRVSGTPHFRFAAGLADDFDQVAGALNIKNNFSTWLTGEHVGGKHHQQVVGINQLARGCDNAQAVAISIEGKANVGPGFVHFADQILDIFWLARIRVVIGEMAINFRKQRDGLNA